MRELGFCVASWQPEVVALATPITTTEACYSLNVSVSTNDSADEVVVILAAPLRELREAISNALARRADE